ncbi:MULTISPECIES: CopG family ribbon-helix-helix protein [Methylomonas]|uniref:Toxin-antitoxin system n=1 Tax=Methylomonas koyamae TaxID=702114 RepID=A0AA91I4F8_9GAMM|nr:MULTISPECIES: ribbon-helix-helix protein, CopG family [Methylomonas]ANE58051.1 toxin-antitoxin system [Methylomonas sp. DH-1]OAI24221.1 toxin-antitoxin system [Methylomonas koyamae]TPQ27569.1 ribbon-helix-helix protein, CopG family [Methylomonas koyamae]
MKQTDTLSKTISTGIKLDETLHARLKLLSQAKDRTPHWLMKAAIEEYVEREEAYEREKREDMERWQKYQQTGHAIPNEAVDAWLSSWGSESELSCPK